MSKTPTIGDAITIETIYGTMEGKVKFATSEFISVDQGGVTAILRFDPNSNSWRFGKASVTWSVKATAVGSILAQLLAIRAKAEVLGYTLPEEQERYVASRRVRSYSKFY